MKDYLKAVTELQAKLVAAHESLEQAQYAALNRCNELQKELDQAIDKWRAAAPNGTDWRTDRYEKD